MASTAAKPKKPRAKKVAAKAPATITATLDQRLRYIDLNFECLRRATAIIDSVHGWQGPAWPGDGLPTPRGKKIGALARRLRLEAMRREGLPMDLLSAAEQPAEIGEAA